MNRIDKVRARLLLAGRDWLERTCGCVVLRTLPHGFDAAYDIGRWKRDVKIIVDVGANVGQSTLAFAETWPGARIYSIEPFTDAFRRLEANVAGQEGVVCRQCALGVEAGSARIRLRSGLLTSSLANTSGAGEDGPDSGTEVVRIRTLDEFCAAENIGRIDLLKIDTEGYDLRVLEGAGQLLGAGRISFLQVEVAMNPYNEKHVPLGDVQHWLESRGYVIFGLYDQTPEWSGEARLRFCNAVFVSADEMRHTPLPSGDPGYFHRRRAAILAGSEADRSRQAGR